MLFFTRAIQASQLLFRRSLSSFNKPYILPTNRLSLVQPNTFSGIFSSQAQPTTTSSYILGILSQRRWKSRGNTYQPSTLRRKRKFGFLARAKSKRTAKILQRRRNKGRWYLTH